MARGGGVRSGVLLVEFVREDEDVVDSDGEDEKGDNFGDDEGDLDAERGEEGDGGRHAEEDDDDPPKSCPSNSCQYKMPPPGYERTHREGTWSPRVAAA